MLADRAAEIEKRHGKLCLAVARPAENSARAIRALRDRIVRAKLAPAGIWTIETGEQFAGLHLNILLPAKASTGIARHAEYVELVRESSRAAAAYIAKRTGMPSTAQFDGRLLGGWGTVSSMIMRNESLQCAAPRAALVNWSLMDETQRAHALKGWCEVPGGYVKGEPARPELSREEYAEIARRNLGKIYATLAGCRDLSV